MQKVSAVMARMNLADGSPGSLVHYCPACDMLHFLPATWQFDGNVESPTFSPSFRQMLGTTGDCHYNVTAGQIVWHNDSYHGRTGTEPMVVLDTIEWLLEWFE